MKTRSLLKPVLLTALIAGTLDILAAFGSFKAKGGEDVVIVLRYIASAVFGKEAFAPSVTMPVAGLLFHYFIALGWTAIFFLLYPKINAITRNKYLAGISYGIVIWLMMNRVVVPLTRAKQPAFELGSAVVGAFIIIFAVGIPIALLADYHYSRARENHR